MPKSHEFGYYSDWALRTRELFFSVNSRLEFLLLSNYSFQAVDTALGIFENLNIAVAKKVSQWNEQALTSVAH